MNNKDEIKALFDTKQRFHRSRVSIPFEEKVKQIIQLQKIGLEFSKHKKTQPEGFRRVWDIQSD